MSLDAPLSAIIDSISQLSPTQRRQLMRRLRVSGLLDEDELATDRNRLAVAPALRADRQQTYLENLPGQAQSAPPAPPHHPVDHAHQRTQAENLPPLDLPTASPSHGQNDDAGYHSPVSGRVVLGTPNAEQAAPANPHLMSPLPGQAPEQPIGIIFDGGSRGNPGRGYGSYALRWPGESQQIVQLQFGNHVTNNEAEYDTLIGALEAVLKRLADSDADPATAKLDIRGDSQLVVNQVNKQWQAKDERMKVRRDRAQELLGNFGRWRLTHHDRSRSVDVLGH